MASNDPFVWRPYLSHQERPQPRNQLQGIHQTPIANRMKNPTSNRIRVRNRVKRQPPR